MSPGAFVALTAVVAVAAMTPGPAVTAIVARAMSDGLRPAMAINAGVVTGDLIFFALAAAGMSAVAQIGGRRSSRVLKYAGAAYLVWQGVQILARQAAPGRDWREPRHESHFWRNYGAGLLLMAGHAQAMLFYAALLPGFVNLSSLTAARFRTDRAHDGRRDRRHQRRLWPGRGPCAPASWPASERSAR